MFFHKKENKNLQTGLQVNIFMKWKEMETNILPQTAAKWHLIF